MKMVARDHAIVLIVVSDGDLTNQCHASPCRLHLTILKQRLIKTSS